MNNYDTSEGNLSLVAEGIYPPLFTDFSYDNLGVLVNQRAVDLFELSGDNTYTTDLGLGGQAAILNDAYGDEYPFVDDEKGKFNIRIYYKGIAAMPGQRPFFGDEADGHADR